MYDTRFSSPLLPPIQLWVPVGATKLFFQIAFSVIVMTWIFRIRRTNFFVHIKVVELFKLTHCDAPQIPGPCRITFAQFSCSNSMNVSLSVRSCKYTYLLLCLFLHFRNTKLIQFRSYFFGKLQNISPSFSGLPFHFAFYHSARYSCLLTIFFCACRD